MKKKEIKAGSMVMIKSKTIGDCLDRVVCEHPDLTKKPQKIQGKTRWGYFIILGWEFAPWDVELFEGKEEAYLGSFRAFLTKEEWINIGKENGWLKESLIIN